MAVSFTGDLTNGSAVAINIAPNTSALAVGMQITGTGIPATTYILTIDGANQITMTNNASATNAGVTISYFKMLAAAVSMSLTVASAARATRSARANPSMALTATASGTNPLKTMAAAVTMSLGASATASNPAKSIAAAVTMSLSAVGTAGAYRHVKGSAQMGLTVDAHFTHTASAVMAPKMTLTTSASFTYLDQGLTVRDVVNDLLLMLEIERCGLAFDFIKKRIINDLNAAMQLIYSRAEYLDYFNRTTKTVTVLANTDSITLDKDIQNVIGPARLSATKMPLRPISSRSQFDLFGHLYLGQSTLTVAQGAPYAFFLESTNESKPDNVKLVLNVVPKPTVNTDILLDVAIEAERFDLSHFCRVTRIGMPHRYIETILLPIARFYQLSNPYFVANDKVPMVQAEYQKAMEILGLVDPKPPQIEASEMAGAK